MRKPNTAQVVYYLTIGCFVLFTGVIIVKLTFWPSCMITGPVPRNGLPSVVCVDGWSVAGLAAMILGVAGTILTLIGALGVAAWWGVLDERLKRQIEELFTRAVKQQAGKLLVQETAFQDLKKQVDRVELEVDKQDQQSKAFQEYILDTVIGPSLLGVPWKPLDGKEEALFRDNYINIDVDLVKNAAPYFEPYLLQATPFLATQIILKIFNKYCQIINHLLSEASSNLDAAFRRASEDKNNDPRYWMQKITVIWTELYRDRRASFSCEYTSIFEP